MHKSLVRRAGGGNITGNAAVGNGHNAAMVKHRVGPAENEINVAGNLAVTVVLFGV